MSKACAADWKQLLITAQEQHAEALADVLTEQGAVSVSLQDAEDVCRFQLTPTHTPLWPTTVVTGLFEPTVNLLAVLAHIDLVFPPDAFSKIEIQELADEDWVRRSQKNFKPQCFGGKLWIYPSWESENLDTSTVNENRATVLLDPGIAFGTGSHPTTALCLEWLGQSALKNVDMMDFGCGSGILGIAAAKLGAQRVWCTDHDEQALQATLMNAQQNQLQCQQTLPVPADATFILLPPAQIPPLNLDLIVANILATPLIELKNYFLANLKPEALLVLSGILAQEAEALLTVYQRDFSLIECVQKDEWVRIVLRLQKR